VIVATFYLMGALFTPGVAEPTRHVSLAMTPDDPHPSPWRDLKAALAKVRDTPTLLALMWLDSSPTSRRFRLTGGCCPDVAKNLYGMDQTGSVCWWQARGAR